MYPANWPAPQDTFPMAPQDTVSHQDSWCCFNDCDSAYHMPGDTRPIGIEIYQTVYAWDIIEIEDVIFFTYDIKNVSGNNLQNCYVGPLADVDIGAEVGGGNNDLCTAIIERTYIVDNDTIIVDNVAYQWQEEEEPGWSSFPGVIGFDLLQTPFDLEWGQDKDNDGIPDQYERDSVYYWNNLPPEMWDVDDDGVPDWRDASENPQLGMTAFKECHNPAPANDSEKYMLLAGYNFQTGVYEPYDTIIPPPQDQTFLISSGPFDLEPDSTVTILFAVLFADWYEIYQFPDTALALVNKRAQLYYDMYWFLSPGIDEHQSTKLLPVNLEICPNPFSYKTDIRWQVPDNSNATMEIYGVTGRLVKQFILPNAYSLVPTCISWDGCDDQNKKLSSGVYFLKFKAGDYSATEKLLLIR